MPNSKTLPPRPGRPGFPKGYGISSKEEGLLSWSWLSERMGKARNYWVGTTRPDGRPHSMPVWGVWVDEALYFGTGSDTRKAHNLAENPAMLIHLESGDEVVILEGVAQVAEEAAVLSLVDDAYEAKYKMRAVSENKNAVWYTLKPRIALGWTEKEFPANATRWVFPDAG